MRQVNIGMGLFEVEAGGQGLMLQRQRHLDQVGDTGSPVQVADIGFDRTDGAETGSIGMLAEGLNHGRQLHRVAQRCAGAVCLDIVDGLCVYTGTD